MIITLFLAYSFPPKIAIFQIRFRQYWQKHEEKNQFFFDAKIQSDTGYDVNGNSILSLMYVQ